MGGRIGDLDVSRSNKGGKGLSSEATGTMVTWKFQ